MSDALAAERASSGVDVQALFHEDVHVGAGSRMLPNRAVLHLCALGHAAHALDALGRIANQRERLVPRRLLGQEEIGICNIELACKAAKGAGLLAHAGAALVPMRLHESLHVGATRLYHARRARLDDHAFAHNRIARGDKFAVALDEADTTRRDVVDPLHPAQGGNVDPGLAASAKQGHAFLDLNFLPIDRQVYHASSPLPVSAPIPNTSQRRQRPHSCNASSLVMGSSTCSKSFLRR